MNSLFIKIFAWFWLAMAVVVAGYVFLVTSAAPPPPELDDPKNTMGQVLQTSGLLSLSILEEQGPEALAQMYEAGSLGGTRRFHFFCDDYPEFSTELAPSAIKEVVEDAKASDGVKNFLTPRVFIFGKRVKSPQGRMGVMVMEADQFRGEFDREIESRYIGPRLTLVIAVGGVLCYWLARSLTAPLKRLRNAVSRLALGDLTVRVEAGPDGGKDEIGVLGRDFNRMAERIEMLVTSQQRLLQDVSHELRSPLTRLNLALALARHHAEERDDALDRIELEAARMNALIGKLLSLTRLETIGQEPPPDLIDVLGLLDSLLPDAELEAHSREASVVILPSDACTVRGHLDLLYSAVENVLRNAIRHTAANTSVEMSCRLTDDNKVLIRIRDHGPGAPEEELSKLAQPFYMVDSRPASGEGSGLGLSIAERVVRQHSGELRFSNAPGGGLAVEMIIPAATAAVPAAV